jgi:uncharacterized membrane protein
MGLPVAPARRVRRSHRPPTVSWNESAVLVIVGAVSVLGVKAFLLPSPSDVLDIMQVITCIMWW